VDSEGLSEVELESELEVEFDPDVALEAELELVLALETESSIDTTKTDRESIEGTGIDSKQPKRLGIIKDCWIMKKFHSKIFSLFSHSSQCQNDSFNSVDQGPGEEPAFHPKHQLGRFSGFGQFHQPRG